MLKNLYAARVPATAAIVPTTAPMTDAVRPKAASKTLLIAPMNTPSRRRTRARAPGLIDLLNELTIARTKPPNAPTIAST